MKLMFKQKLISFLDGFNVYDENENVVYKIKQRVGFTRTFDIMDKEGVKIARVKRKFINFFTKTYKCYINGQKVGTIKKLFSFFVPKFKINFNGWNIDGSYLEFNYQITKDEKIVATASKKFISMTDTYELDIENPEDALSVVMIAVAIDSEKAKDSKRQKKKK